jgi:hypothetical protein
MSLSVGESKTIQIECDRCGLVDARVIGAHSIYNDEVAEPQETILANCPNCDQPLLAQQWYFEEYWHPEQGTVGSWTPPKRAWPNPDPSIPWELPEVVRTSLVEAQKCLHANAHLACAVMCGRALEAMGQDLNANESMLAKGLKELRDSGKIDERLYEWGEELRDKRNIAAHPNAEDISQRDAQYLFDFALAICDYIYVLSAKFERFKRGE